MSHKNFENIILENLRKNSSVVYDVKAVLPKVVIDGRL
jgi:hypothetical protein